MATNYKIIEAPKGEPFSIIVTTGGEPIANLVVPKWAERIVLALKLLDAQEHDGRIAAYVEKIKREMGQ